MLMYPGWRTGRNGTQRSGAQGAYVGVHARVHAGTDERDEFVASFVNDKRANLTLEALPAKAPDEDLAVAAEGRLLEEARYELVLLDLVHKLLTQSAATRELLEL